MARTSTEVRRGPKWAKMSVFGGFGAQIAPLRKVSKMALFGVFGIYGLDQNLADLPKGVKTQGGSRHPKNGPKSTFSTILTTSSFITFLLYVASMHVMHTKHVFIRSTNVTNVLKVQKVALAAPTGPQGRAIAETLFWGVRAPQIWEGLTKYSVIWYPRFIFLYDVVHKTLHFWYRVTQTGPPRGNFQ